MEQPGTGHREASGYTLLHDKWPRLYTPRVSHCHSRDGILRDTRQLSRCVIMADAAWVGNAKRIDLRLFQGLG